MPVQVLAANGPAQARAATFWLPGIWRKGYVAKALRRRGGCGPQKGPAAGAGGAGCGVHRFARVGQRGRPAAAKPGVGILHGDRRSQPAAVRAAGLPGRPGVRSGQLRPAAKPAGASLDARDLGADLRDLQDLPGHSGQVHPAPGGLHRRGDGLLLRLCCRTSRPPRSPPSWLFSLVGIGGSYGVAWFGIRINTFANSRIGLRQPEGQAVSDLRHPAEGRHVDRHAADQRSSCC